MYVCALDAGGFLRMSLSLSLVMVALIVTYVDKMKGSSKSCLTVKSESSFSWLSLFENFNIDVVQDYELFIYWFVSLHGCMSVDTILASIYE